MFGAILCQAGKYLDSFGGPQGSAALSRDYCGRGALRL